MNDHQIFLEFEKHLMMDQRPSDYFYSLLKENWFKTQNPYKMLEVLSRIEQSPVHHPEGDVFVHTMMVLDNAAERKGNSKNPRVFMWAALLHDLGKATTTRNRNGKITAYDHDRAGESLSVEFLAQYKEFVDSTFIRQVSKLVRWHMQILFVTKNMKYSNVKQMIKETDFEEVALLGLCDRLGRGNLDDDKIKEIDESISLFLSRCKDQT